MQQESDMQFESLLEQQARIESICEYQLQNFQEQIKTKSCIDLQQLQSLKRTAIEGVKSAMKMENTNINLESTFCEVI